MANLSLEKFTGQNKWDIYMIQLNEAFKTNDIIDEGLKASKLILSLSDEALEVLLQLCGSKTELERKTYIELCALLQQKYGLPEAQPVPVPAPIVFPLYGKRREFYNAKQKQKESVQDWKERLEKLADPCEFGDRMPEIIKDKFITGLVRPSVFKKMYEIEPPKSLGEFFDAAVERESNIIPRPRKKQKRNVRNVKKCYACGKTDYHNFYECIAKYKNYECKFCKKTGHLTKACFSKAA